MPVIPCILEAEVEYYGYIVRSCLKITAAAKQKSETNTRGKAEAGKWPGSDWHPPPSPSPNGCHRHLPALPLHFIQDS